MAAIATAVISRQPAPANFYFDNYFGELYTPLYGLVLCTPGNTNDY